MKNILVISIICLGFSMPALGDTGVVKWYNQSKGYGFIIPDDGGGDIFLYAADLSASLYLLSPREGQCVKFDLAVIPRSGEKFRAVNVHNCN